VTGSNVRQKIVSDTDLPESWGLKPIGEVCNFEKGKKPKNTGHRSDTRTVPYINIKAFETGNPEEYAESGNYPMCSKHDVLIVWDGARSGLVGSGVSGYIGSTLSKIWSHEIDNKYLFYFLRSQYYYINTNTKGVGIPHVDPGILNAIKIPIAPPNEQNLIVAEIEKQFSRLDEAVGALKRIQANLKRYKASVLKAAVEGKLTEEWRRKNPDVEPASELLKCILAERRKKWEEDYVKKYVGAHGHAPKDDSWRKKYKEPDLPIQEEMVDLPQTWVWSSLGQLSWSVKDGPHYSPKYSASGIPFITGGNVRPEGIDFSTAKYISPELHSKLSERCKPEYGDLLYTKGGTTGIARINTETREFSVWVHVAVLKLVDSIERFYLQHALNSPFCYKQSQKYTHGVGNQDLGLTRMVWISIALPPLEEQKIIVKECERRMSISDEISKEVETNLKRAERLRQSILKEAFSGRLMLYDK